MIHNLFFGLAAAIYSLLITYGPLALGYYGIRWLLGNAIWDCENNRYRFNLKYFLGGSLALILLVTTWPEHQKFVDKHLCDTPQDEASDPPDWTS